MSFNYLGELCLLSVIFNRFLKVTILWTAKILILWTISILYSQLSRFVLTESVLIMLEVNNIKIT